MRVNDSNFKPDCQTSCPEDYCCVGTSRLAENGYDQSYEAGTPCPNLRDCESGQNCTIHEKIAEMLEWKKCHTYDCGGAGQVVSGVAKNLGWHWRSLAKEDPRRTGIFEFFGFLQYRFQYLRDMELNDQKDWSILMPDIQAAVQELEADMRTHQKFSYEAAEAIFSDPKRALLAALDGLVQAHLELSILREMNAENA